MHQKFVTYMKIIYQNFNLPTRPHHIGSLKINENINTWFGNAS